MISCAMSLQKSLDATDLDAQALEEEADEEFLLLDDVITEVSQHTWHTSEHRW